MDQEPPYSLWGECGVCCYYFKKLWPRWRWGWLGSGPLVVCRSWRQQWQHGMRERVGHGDWVCIFVRLRWGRRWEVHPWTWAVPLKASVGTSAPQIREVPGGHLWPRPSPHPLTPRSAERGALSLPGLVTAEGTRRKCASFSTEDSGTDTKGTHPCILSLRRSVLFPCAWTSLLPLDHL